MKYYIDEYESGQFRPYFKKFGLIKMYISAYNGTSTDIDDVSYYHTLDEAKARIDEYHSIIMRDKKNNILKGTHTYEL